jgi:putative oxidoreductase
MLRRFLDGTTRHVPTSIGLLVLRVGSGGMMIAGHGWSKLSRFPDMAGRFPDPLGIGHEASMALATFAEFFCAGAIVLGLATRFAAIPLVVNMVVAGFIVHAADPWKRKELAFTYLVFFLTLLFTGGGKFSLDAAMSRGGGRR